MTARTGMDAAHFDLARGGRRKGNAPPPSDSLGTLWEHVAPAPATDLVGQLVAIAKELEQLHTREHGPLYGVTIGEVVFEAEENRGIKVGGAPMDDKVKEQRQTSWLPRVMKQAGFVTTASYRASPVKRHHSTPHKVWIRREVTP